MEVALAPPVVAEVLIEHCRIASVRVRSKFNTVSPGSSREVGNENGYSIWEIKTLLNIRTTRFRHRPEEPGRKALGVLHSDTTVADPALR